MKLDNNLTCVKLTSTSQSKFGFMMEIALYSSLFTLTNAVTLSAQPCLTLRITAAPGQFLAATFTLSNTSLDLLLEPFACCCCHRLSVTFLLPCSFSCSSPIPPTSHNSSLHHHHRHAHCRRPHTPGALPLVDVLPVLGVMTASIYSRLPCCRSCVLCYLHFRQLGDILAEHARREPSLLWGTATAIVYCLIGDGEIAFEHCRRRVNSKKNGLGDVIQQRTALSFVSSSLAFFVLLLQCYIFDYL